MTRRYIVPSLIVGIILAPLIAFLGGQIVMRLWNWLVPSIIGWRQITPWEGFGMLALCRILFGGHSFGRSHYTQRTPEERERMRRRLRERIRERFGFAEPSPTQIDGQ